MATVDLDAKGEQIKKIATWACIALALAAGLAATASLATLAVESLIAWGTGAVFVFVGVNFAPAFGDWVRNKRIQAIVALAEANPIETMQNLWADKKQELDRQDNAITAFETEFRNVSQMVDDLHGTDPEEAKQYEAMRDQMEVGLTELRNEQTAATGELSRFKLQVDKARRIYKVAGAMNKALEVSQSAQAVVFAKIKEDVAFDKVRSDLNRAFANLNSAVERRKNAALFAPKTQASLPAPQQTIDAQVTPVTKVTISR